MNFLENPNVKKFILTTMIFLTLMLVIAGSGFIFQAARAQTTTPTPSAPGNDLPPDQVRTITVNGSGVVAVEPDRAVFVIGVESQAETAGEAMQANNERMQAVIDALKAAGVAEADLQTQSLALYPQYEDVTRPVTTDRQITGYVAHNTVQVKTGSLDGLGDLLDAAIAAGGNTIQGVYFEISDPGAAADQARQLAWDNARHKAEQLADLAGAELGPVLTVTEYSSSVRPVIQDMASEESAGGGTPIQPGRQENQVSVDVTWQLLNSTSDSP